MWLRSTKTFHTHWKSYESRNLALEEQQYQILKAKDTWALETRLIFIQVSHHPHAQFKCYNVTITYNITTDIAEVYVLA